MNAEERLLRQKIIELVGRADGEDVAVPIFQILDQLGTTTVDPRALLDRMTIEDSLVRRIIATVPCYQLNPVKRAELDALTQAEALPASTEPELVPVPTPVEATHQPPRVHGRIERIGDAILELLEERGDLTGPTIMQALAVPQPILSKAILSLEAKGLITRSGPKFRPVYSAARVNATRSGDTAAAPLALEQKVLDDTLRFHQERAELEAKLRGWNPSIVPESKAIAVDAQTAIFALRSDLRLAIDTGDVSIVLSPECTVALANYLDHTCSLVLPARAPMTEKH